MDPDNRFQSLILCGKVHIAFLDSLGELTRDQSSNAHIYILADNKQIQFEDYLNQYFMGNKYSKSA